MDNRDIILNCLNENWPDEMSMIGDDLATRIVDDALKGIRTPIKRSRGGYNFDLTPYIDTIIAAASLLVSFIEVWINWRDKKSQQPHDPNHTEEEIVRILADIVKEAMKLEPVKATKLARVFIRVVLHSDHQ